MRRPSEVKAQFTFVYQLTPILSNSAIRTFTCLVIWLAKNRFALGIAYVRFKPQCVRGTCQSVQISVSFLADRRFATALVLVEYQNPLTFQSFADAKAKYGREVVWIDAATISTISQYLLKYNNTRTSIESGNRSLITWLLFSSLLTVYRQWHGVWWVKRWLITSGRGQINLPKILFDTKTLHRTRLLMRSWT